MTIVFDFDGTLIKNDLANITLERHIYKMTFRAKVIYNFLKLFKRFFLIGSKNYKRLVLKYFGSPSSSTLEANELIWNEKTLDILRNYQLHQCNKVIISTASELVLVKQALLLKNIEVEVQGSLIETNTNEYKLLNLGKEKVTQLLQAGVSHVDLFFTDNIIADYPLIKFSNQVVLASPNNKKMIINKLGSWFLKNVTLL